MKSLSKFVFNIWAIFIFLTLILNAAAVTPASATAANAEPMLSLKSGNHMLGFASGGMYAATASSVLRVNFLNANQTQPQADSNAQIFSRASYSNLWDGIALEYSAPKNGVYTTTYTLAPNADVNQIQLQYNAPISLNKNGSLAIAFEFTTLTESAPIAWQVINGKRVSVEVAFSLREQTLGFTLGAYNPHYALIIDPTLTTWTTSIPNTNTTTDTNGIAYYGGYIYITGQTDGSWGTPIVALHGDYDAFVAKLDVEDGSIVWNTFLGSSNSDGGFGIAVDSTGVYITGFSVSTWGSPSYGFGGGIADAFAAKLDLGGALQWNQFMGAGGFDEGWGIALDSSSDVYITGDGGTGWTTMNSVNPVYTFSGGSTDAFVVKLNSSGVYQWHTFLGGAGDDYAFPIAVRGSYVYVSGKSESQAWNTVKFGSPIRAYTAYEAFVVKLNTSNGVKQWYTFLGGSGPGDTTESGTALAVDSSDNVYVGGYTSGSTWVTPIAAYGSSSPNGMLVKLNSSGVVEWFIRIDQIRSLAVDSNNDIFTGGDGNTPFGSPLREGNGGNDGLTAKFNTSGTLLWHTYYNDESTFHIMAYDDTNDKVFYAAQSHVVFLDTTPPTVTNVTSSDANAVYFAGEEISIDVTFNEDVVLSGTGTPQLALETGAVDNFASYVSGSGTDTLTFEYVVREDDLNIDLDYLSTSSLTLNGRTITDENLNYGVVTLPAPGAAGSLGANKTIGLNASFIVTKAADTADGTCDSDCSLREAITASNLNGSGLDVIAFDDDYTITLTTGTQLPAVTTEIIINGTSAENTIIQADATANTATYRVFEVLSGDLTLDSLTVQNGKCNGSCDNTTNGAGIYNGGALTVANSAIKDNYATNGTGGGIHNAGLLTISNTSFSGNYAGSSGGGAIYIGGNTVEISGSSFTDNHSTNNHGGAIHNIGDLTVTNTTFADNSASGNGGAIYNHVLGDLEMIDSAMTNNSSNQGGGIYNAGDLNVIGSLFDANLANGGSSNGGGIDHEGNNAFITNSTFAGNSATQYGGGIYSSGASAIVISHSTFSGNSAPFGGGLFNTIGNNLSLTNSLFANSPAPTVGDCYNNSGNTIGTNINNLIETNGFNNSTSLCGAPTVSADPKLGALQNNGGNTETMLPAASSLAINMGDNASCEDEDQRGISRPQGLTCDIGAAERASFGFQSAAANDGWTLESREFSNLANKNNIVDDLRVGDDKLKKQYRSILYFDTADIPNNAIITSATVRIKKQSVTGDVSSLGNLIADIKKGFFNNNALLENMDFSAAGEKINSAGTFANLVPAADWHQMSMAPANFKYINIFGATQFRLRYAKDDDGDKFADLINFYSGEDGDDAPQFIIEYQMP